MKYNCKEYVKDRNGNWYPISKKEINSRINIYDFNTVLPFLKELDYPAIEDQWIKLVKYWENKNSNCIFTKYIAIMNLCAYKPFRFKDSFYL